MLRGFDNPCFSDMVLYVGDKAVVHLNSLVMVSASRYFDVMLATPMKESKERVVRVDDVVDDAHVFTLLLKSAYSRDAAVYWDGIPEVNHRGCCDAVIHLGVLADRFCFQDTMKWVEQRLVGILFS